jgi:hypothetical protein
LGGCQFTRRLRRLQISTNFATRPLPEDEAVFTSALVFLSPTRGIARTASRWYRLGKQRESKGWFQPEMDDVQAFLQAQLVLLDAARPIFERR